MKTMKIWRKSRLSESRANSFANGRTGAIYAIAFAILAAFSLASCSSDDDDKDITKEIIMNVSAEPGVMYDLFDSMGEHPIECMRVMTQQPYIRACAHPRRQESGGGGRACGERSKIKHQNGGICTDLVPRLR